MQPLQGGFPQPFPGLLGEVVNVVFGQAPHERPHDLRFVAVAEVLRRGDQLHTQPLQLCFPVHVLSQVPGNAVVFVYQDDREAPLPCVPY